MSKELYEQGLKNRENDLRAYNGFMENIGLDSLEAFIDEQFPDSNITVLDIGCGNAGALQELKVKRGNDVQCIGIDEVKFEAEIDEKIVGNVLEKKLPEADLILSFRAMHEIGQVEVMLEKIANAVKENGKAVLSVRCQYVGEEGIQFEGKMNDKDINFVKELAIKERIQQNSVQGTEIHTELVFREDIEQGKYLYGAFIFMRKPAP